MKIPAYTYTHITERGLYALKPQETKTEFIRLRAEGRSYSYIADTLHISKSTCTEWERELKAQIAELRQEQLNELYSSYAMTKEAKKPVFIVEGELDALSIIEVGGEAVALGSTTKAKALVELLKTQKPSQPLIIALDNDTAGHLWAD